MSGSKERSFFHSSFTFGRLTQSFAKNTSHFNDIVINKFWFFKLFFNLCLQSLFSSHIASRHYVYQAMKSHQPVNGTAEAGEVMDAFLMDFLAGQLKIDETLTVAKWLRRLIK